MREYLYWISRIPVEGTALDLWIIVPRTVDWSRWNV